MLRILGSAELSASTFNAASPPRLLGSRIGGIVEFDQVTKSYGTVTAVRDVSLTIGAGELVALLGPSGSGKTTLLMMLAGLEKPDGGDIRVNGSSVLSLPPNRRGFGMVFQKYTLFPHMNVGRNIGFPLEIRGVSRSERQERINHSLAVVRLEGYQDRMPHQLSGGQQQRVALARSLVYGPPLLLMDEPFAALDRKLRMEMQIELKRIQEELGVTAIFVTHDQEEALRIADRIAVMNAGQVEQVAEPKTLYALPSNPFVADFIGTINFIPADLTISIGDRAARLLIGTTQIHLSHTAGDAAAMCPAGRVRLALRPEALRITDPDDDQALLLGCVRETLYLGDRLICDINLDNTEALVQAYLPANDPRAVRDRRVGLAWAADDMRVFPA
jgi:mannopine transport system ATP-binding protein